MTQSDWYNEVADYIQDNIEKFYIEFYDSEIQSLGSDYRLNPCPVCGHKDCCTISGNAVHCFSGSCTWRGTHIQAWQSFAVEQKKLPLFKAMQKLEEFSGLVFPESSPEEQERQNAVNRLQTLYLIAESIFHKQLMTSERNFMFNGKMYTPLQYLLYCRRRSEKTILDLKWGFVDNYQEFKEEAYAEGYNYNEIKLAKMFFPDGLFVFPYHHPKTNNIIRFNTKNPFNMRIKKKDSNGELQDGEVIKGFSIGDKSYYFSPRFNFKEPFIIVEGEHDLAAVYENGWTNICCTGGTLKKETIYILDKAESNIYIAFDHDEAGEKYTLFVNEELADKPIFKINFGDDYNDIDDYYRECQKSLSVQQLVNSAEPLETSKFKVRHSNNLWSIGTRQQRLEFFVRGKTEKGISGDASYYTDGELIDRDDGILLSKCKVKFRPLNFHLTDCIEEFYNSDIDKKSLEELAKVFKLSTKKQQIILRMATIIDKSNDIEKDVSMITKILGASDETTIVIDTILKEVNNVKNINAQATYEEIRQIKIAHSFYPKYDLAYMYFTYYKADMDGTLKKIPYLLRNDKQLIRLDLFRQKDPQCMLLLDNLLELPSEVKNAIGDPEEISLSQAWVEKFINNECLTEELNPSIIAKDVLRIVERFYYFEDQRLYKVIALYIYMTYVYDLFSSIPYLYLNGEKGSGKSTLNAILYALCFNPKMAVGISESALFRTVANEGGTMILDEIENLTSRSKSQENGMATILKGGYTRSGKIYRTNTEAGNKTEGFEVYGPKIIANIFGLDDVIEDRCIRVKIPKINLTEDKMKENIHLWYKENGKDVKALTSRMALSSLVYFQDVFKIYTNLKIQTFNTRFSQILMPMVTIAKWVDADEVKLKITQNPDLDQNLTMGEFEKAFTDYYENDLSEIKQIVDSDTQEGIIRNFMVQISREFLDLIPDDLKDFTKPEDHKYKESLRWDANTLSFVINSLHIKTFIEESAPEMRNVSIMNHRIITTMYSFKKGETKRKYITVKDEQLIEQMSGVARPRIYEYTINIRDKFPEIIKEKEIFEKNKQKSIDDIISDNSEDNIDEIF